MDPEVSAPMALEAQDAKPGMEIDGGHLNTNGLEQDAILAELLKQSTEAPQEENGGTSTGNAPDASVQTGPYCQHNEPPHHTHTCFHPFHSGYSEKNIPLVLFRLDPPRQINHADVGLLMENGESVNDYGGRPIRDFPFLPRYISSRPSGWLLEYWMRTDNRLTYRDIKARMTGPDVLPTDNVLNMRREREARMPLGLSCWTARRGEITRAEVERVQRLTPDQVAFNTTMTIEYVKTLDDCGRTPGCLRSKSIKSFDSQFFPLETFINGGTELHTPSPRLAAAIEMLLELQKTAMSIGLGSWRQLPVEKQPASWGRRGNKKDKEADRDTNAKNPNTNNATNGGSAVVSTLNDGDKATQSVFAPNSDWGYTGNGYTTTQSDTAGWGSSAFNTTATTTGTATTPFDSNINSPAVDAQYTARIALAALSTIEPGQSPANVTPADQENKANAIPVDPRLFNYDAMAINGGAGIENHYSDPGMVELYRFNGAGAFSIRQNGLHRLNTNTPEIMERNDPFASFRQPSINLQRSFEKYVMEDIVDGQDTR